MGLSLSVTCAAETLVFYHQNHLLRLGVRRCMHLVLAAFLVRMGAYAALAHAPSPWLVRWQGRGGCLWGVGSSMGIAAVSLHLALQLLLAH